MSSLYKTHEEKIADIIAASASTDFRWAPTRSGTLALKATGLYDRHVLEDQRAAAIARLAIDKAMRPPTSARGEAQVS